MRRLALLLTLAAVLGAAPLLAAGPLDGKTFTGEVGEQGKTKGDPDTLVFKGGTFRSTACDKYNFAVTPYTVKEDRAMTLVEAKAKNPKGETMEWSLSTFGELMSGTAVYKSAGKAPVTYWVKAKLKKS